MVIHTQSKATNSNNEIKNTITLLMPQTEPGISCLTLRIENQTNVYLIDQVRTFKTEDYRSSNYN